MSVSFERRRVLGLTSFVMFALTSSSCTPVEYARAPSIAKVMPAGELDARTFAAVTRRARERGLPLLVMLDDWRTDGDFRGDQWAVVLDFAPPAILAELGLCELAFARPEQVAELWPGIPPDEGASPFALLLRDPPTGPVKLFVATPAPSLELLHDKSRTEELYPWLRDVYLTLHRELAPDEANFERAAQRVLGERAGTRAECEAELASSTRARRMRAPAGARWIDPDAEEYRRPGCGATPCGAAATPKRSRRFLTLLAEQR